MVTIDYRSKKFYLLILQLFLVVVGLLAVYALVTQKFIIQKKAALYPARLDLPATLNAAIGSDINVPIFLSTKGASIVGVDVVISFDKEKLALTDILTNAKDNTSLKTFAPVALDVDRSFDKRRVQEKANTEGVIDFGAVTFDSEVPTAAFKDDNVILATLVFRSQVAGTTNVNFNFTPGSTTDSNIVTATDSPVDTLESVTNLSLNITGGPTATPGGCPRKSQGDADCDGSIDGIDYSMWLNSQCRSSSTQGCASIKADFNGDGNVDDDDYVIWFGNRGT